MTKWKIKVARVVALAGLLIVSLGVSAALADPGNGNGPPTSPPGQGACEHGNSGQECKPDPQPSHGKDCDEHGNQGGVNEDHCLDTPPPTTTSGTTTDQDPTTDQETTTSGTTTTQTTTSATTTQGTTTTTNPITTPTPPPPGSTTTTPGTVLLPAGPSEGVLSASAVPLTKSELQTVLAKQAQKVGTVPASHEPRTGELPFTGLPIWILATIGSAMLAAGFALRRFPALTNGESS
jgi:hypothetical protein